MGYHFRPFAPVLLTLPGGAVGEDSPLLVSQRLAFPFRSAESFGLPSAMSPRHELGRTLAPNGVQGRRPTTKPFDSALRSEQFGLELTAERLRVEDSGQALLTLDQRITLRDNAFPHKLWKFQNYPPCIIPTVL